MDHSLFAKKLLPAVTLTNVESAFFVTEALLKGGLNVMEITFRTPAAEEAIGKIADEFPEMHIGAGTILSANQISTAQQAGAQFGLAPGYNEKVGQVAQQNKFPFIPGVLTPTELETALNNNFHMLKLFPAQNLGGPDYIKRLRGPYQHTDVQFIPMGGVNLSNIKSYLDISSVTAVGGSWLAPNKLIANKKFSKITEIVRRSIDLSQQ